MAKNKRKKLIEKTDGLGPLEKKKIRTALRLVWHRSHARKLVVDRCKDKDGYSHCEACFQKTPALKVDHIVPCGEVDGGFIERLFVPSRKLQGLCPECHKVKTRLDRAHMRKRKAGRG